MIFTLGIHQKLFSPDELKLSSTHRRPSYCAQSVLAPSSSFNGVFRLFNGTIIVTVFQDLMGENSTYLSAQITDFLQRDHPHSLWTAVDSVGTGILNIQYQLFVTEREITLAYRRSFIIILCPAMYHTMVGVICHLSYSGLLVKQKKCMKSLHVLKCKYSTSSAFCSWLKDSKTVFNSF